MLNIETLAKILYILLNNEKLRLNVLNFLLSEEDRELILREENKEDLKEILREIVVLFDFVLARKILSEYKLDNLDDCLENSNAWEEYVPYVKAYIEKQYEEVEED